MWCGIIRPLRSHVTPLPPPFRILPLASLRTQLRRRLERSRDVVPLFDTPRWVKHLEYGLSAVRKFYRPVGARASCIA